MSFHRLPVASASIAKPSSFRNAAVQATAFTGGFHAQRRRIRRIRESHALGGPNAKSSRCPITSALKKPRFIEPINTIRKPCRKLAWFAGETVLIVGCGPMACNY